MTLELTAGVLALGVGWITSSLTAAWVLSRRSKQWDEIEDAIVVLFGDRRSGQKGLVQRFDDLKDDVELVAERQRGALKALHANLSTEGEVESAVRATIDYAVARGKMNGPPPTL